MPLKVKYDILRPVCKLLFSYQVTGILCFILGSLENELLKEQTSILTVIPKCFLRKLLSLYIRNT